MDWHHVDYLWIIVMFLWAVWALILTAPIQRIHWWAKDVILNFSKKKQTYLHLGRPKRPEFYSVRQRLCVYSSWGFICLGVNEFTRCSERGKIRHRVWQGHVWFVLSNENNSNSDSEMNNERRSSICLNTLKNHPPPDTHASLSEAHKQQQLTGEWSSCSK